MDFCGAGASNPPEFIGRHINPNGLQAFLISCPPPGSSNPFNRARSRGHAFRGRPEVAILAPSSAQVPC